jgi:hypothetical protein
MSNERRRLNPELVSLSAYCLGFCGRNTMDDPGTWWTIDGSDTYWCESCWREVSVNLTQQERDAARQWVQPSW